MERRCHFRRSPIQRLNKLIDTSTSNRFDTTNACRHPLLAGKVEEANLARRLTMRTTTQLQRNLWYGDDAHPIPVFLPEERHRSSRNCIGIVHLPRLDFGILPEVPVYFLFDITEFLIRHRHMMREIEPESVWIDDRAGLGYMLAKQPPKRRVDEVRGRVIALDVAPSLLRNLGTHRCRFEITFVWPRDNLLAIYLQNIIDGQLPPLSPHDTGVRNLTTGLGVERVFFQNEVESIVGLTECEDVRFRFGRFIADKPLSLPWNDPRKSFPLSPFLFPLLLHVGC